MEPKAENVVQNIGAMAETVSVFYNSMARQVPKEVALELTKHFMDLTITRRPVVVSPETKTASKAIAEIQKEIMGLIEKRKQAAQNTAPPEKTAETVPQEGVPAKPEQMQTASGGASATQKPGTPRPPKPEDRPGMTTEQDPPEA